MLGTSVLLSCLGAALAIAVAYLLHESRPPAATARMPQAVIAAVVLVAKSIVELGALRRIRRASDAVLEGPAARFAALWLIAFLAVIGAALANLVYLAMCVLLAVIGLVVAIVVSIATLFLQAGKAFETYLDVLNAAFRPFQWEGDALSAGLASPSGRVIFLVLIIAAAVGPTAVAVMVLWTRTKRPSEARAPPR